MKSLLQRISNWFTRGVMPLPVCEEAKARRERIALWETHIEHLKSKRSDAVARKARRSHIDAELKSARHELMRLEQEERRA